MEYKKDIKMLFSADSIEAEIKKLGKMLNEEYGEKEIYMICVLKGAVMFATDLAKTLTMPLKMEFIRLSSYGSGTISSGKVNAVDISLPDLNGKNVLVVEDIIDTGHTAKFLIDFINHNFHTESLKFCSLLDKKVRREVDVDADYHCFEVDDKFLVGYGLDFDGYYRNLPYIGYI
mgnify:CR=1 FL=1